MKNKTYSDNNSLKICLDFIRCANIYASEYKNKIYSEGLALSPAEFFIITYLHRYSDKRLSMSEIAALLGYPKSTFTKIVDPLVIDGYIKKEHPKDNSKTILLTLTKRGVWAYEQLSKSVYHILLDLDSMLEKNPKRMDYYAEAFDFFTSSFLQMIKDSKHPKPSSIDQIQNAEFKNNLII